MHELANTAWALATVRHAENAELLFRSQAQARVSSQQLANLFWAAARLQVRTALEGMAGEVAARCGELSAVQLGAAVWACAAGQEGHGTKRHGGMRDPKLLLALEEEAVAKRGELSSRVLANILWGFATLQWRSQETQELHACIFDEAVQKRHCMRSQELAMCAWALASLEAVEELGRLLQAPLSMDALEPRETASLAWALTHLPAAAAAAGAGAAVLGAMRRMVRTRELLGFDDRSLAALVRSLPQLRLAEAFNSILRRLPELGADLGGALLCGAGQLGADTGPIWAALKPGEWREEELVPFVRAYAEERPDSVLRAAEEFCASRKVWMKVAGSQKAQLLEALLRATRPKRILEVGCYVGFTAIRLASTAQAWGGRVVSLEMDPTMARVANQLVSHAKLSEVVDIQVGHSEQLLPRLGQEFDFVFFDQRGSRFGRDLQLLEPWLAAQAVVLADNVLKPGAPAFLWQICGSQDWETRVVELLDFGPCGVLDWMSISRRRGLGAHHAHHAQLPESFAHLAWQADEMRWRSIDGHVTPQQWDEFARYMKASLAKAGLRPHLQHMEDVEWLRDLGAVEAKGDWETAGDGSWCMPQAEGDQLASEKKRAGQDPSSFVACVVRQVPPDASTVEMAILDLNQKDLWQGQRLDANSLLALRCVPEEQAMDILGSLFSKGSGKGVIRNPNDYLQAAVAKIMRDGGSSGGGMNFTGNQTRQRAQQLGLYLEDETLQALSKMPLRASVKLLEGAVQAQSTGEDPNNFITMEVSPNKKQRIG
ncbi:unnamed protein product [Effrenium voratum]|nr:unnamed protein product [Effrenium voratum]